MNIILFAHQNWGIETIRTINKTSHNIVQVFTHPLDMDKNEKIWYDSVAEECHSHKIPVKERTSLTDDDYRGLPGHICAIRNNGIIVTCSMNHKENQTIFLSSLSFENNKTTSSDFFKL